MAHEGWDGKSRSKIDLTRQIKRDRLWGDEFRAIAMNMNVTIREDQQVQLKAISDRTGIDEAELIPQGIDLVIAEKRAVRADWRESLQAIFGIWKDRDDLDDVFKSFRDEIEDRHAKLFVDTK
jgi:hypothetical protein